MSQPIHIYSTTTGEHLVMAAPTTALEMVQSGEWSYEPVEIAPAAATTPAKSIADMTKAELLAEAQRLGIATTDSMTKAQLLDLIAAGS